MLADGLTWADIRAKLDCSDSYIDRWSKRFTADRLAGLFARHAGRERYKVPEHHRSTRRRTPSKGVGVARLGRCGVSPMLRPCRTVWTGLSSLIVSILETIKFINRPFKTRENPHTTSHRRTPPCSSGKGSGSGHSLTEWVFFGLSRFQEKDHDPQEFRFCFHRRRAARLRHRLCRRLAACCG
ncbi:MAG: helix-turn-helix domain-containing protein [Comamonas sp.]